MISFPGALKDPSIESLISQGSNVVPPLYTYDPTTFSYKEVTEIKPGEGYWILSLANGSLTVDSITISSMLLNLKPGWNMIGGVNGPVDFSNPQDVPDDSVIYPIYTYNPVSFGYEEKTIIESKMGYWVLALQECTVTLSTNAAPAKKNTTKPSRTTVPDWTVIIQINASKYSKELSLGVQSGASDGFDPYIDKATPPSPGISSKRAEASFEIEDRVVKHLNRDIKNDKNVVWKMRIDSPMDDVELSWDSSSIHLEKDLCIQYESSEINMRSEKSIKIPSGNHILTIILKDRIPTKPELLQNYPNPFNPETWIPYHLSEDSNVYIRIYNSSGYLVRTLDLGYRLAGYYRSKDKAAYWDGDNETGEKVSSGVYFYTIQAGKYTDTKKMVILR